MNQVQAGAQVPTIPPPSATRSLVTLARELAPRAAQYAARLASRRAPADASRVISAAIEGRRSRRAHYSPPRWNLSVRAGYVPLPRIGRPPERLDNLPRTHTALRYLQVRAKQGDEAARAELILVATTYARKNARQWLNERGAFDSDGPEFQSIDDAQNAAVLAAIEAVDRWDPDKGALSTFLRHRIKGEIADTMRREARHADRERTLYDAPPINPEFADLRPGERTVAQNIAEADEPIWDMWADPTPSPAVAIERKDLLDYVLAHVSPESAEILRDRFGVDRVDGGLGRRELAALLGVSRSTSDRRLRRALREAREVAKRDPGCR